MKISYLFISFCLAALATHAGIPYPAITNQLMSRTNIEALVQGIAPPFVNVYPDGTYTYRGVRYTTTNSPTSGIQEAIDLLSGKDENGKRTTQGGTVYFSPGTFYTFQGIKIPYGSNVFTINFEGSGKSSCGIMYIGDTVQSVVTIGTGYYLDVENFTMKNMFIGSDLNMMTNLLTLHGAYQSNYGGAIESVEIHRCWFRYGANSTFGDLNKPGETKYDLRGIEVDCNFDDIIKISDNTFNFLNCGISWAADWGAIENNQFLFCGSTNKYSIIQMINSYPVSSPYKMGAAVLIKESTSPSGLWNGHKNWYINGNNFVNCGPHYISILPTSSSGWMLLNKVRVYNDGREDNDNAALYASTGNSIYFINSRFYAASTWNKSYLITNTSDYSTWQNTLATNGMVNVTDFINLTNNLGYKSISTTNAPSAGQVITTDSTNLYWATPTATNTAGGSATNAIANTNGIGTNLLIYSAGYTLPTLSVSNGVVDVRDTNGYKFFIASNGAVSISASNTANTAPALLLAINTNNVNEVIVPQGYAYGRSLMASNIMIGTNGYLWNSNNSGALYWITSTKTNLISDGR